MTNSKCAKCGTEIDIEEAKMNNELYEDDDGNYACEQCSWNQEQ